MSRHFLRPTGVRRDPASAENPSVVLCFDGRINDVPVELEIVMPLHLLSEGQTGVQKDGYSQMIEKRSSRDTSPAPTGARRTIERLRTRPRASHQESATIRSQS